MTTVYGYPESETACLVDDVYDLSQVDDHQNELDHQHQKMKCLWEIIFNQSSFCLIFLEK